MKNKPSTVIFTRVENKLNNASDKVTLKTQEKYFT